MRKIFFNSEINNTNHKQNFGDTNKISKTGKFFVTRNLFEEKDFFPLLKTNIFFSQK